jgi:hypothetical protein
MAAGRLRLAPRHPVGGRATSSKGTRTVTSPYSSNLLQHPAEGQVDEPAFSAPRPFSAPTEPVEPVTTPAYPYEQHAQPRTAPQQPQPPVQREVVRYVQQQAPVQYAPQPVYVNAPAPKQRGSFGTALVLGLVVILLGVVALVGGYYATKQASPSEFEAATQVGLASDFGFQQGRLRGVQTGREAAVELGATTSRLSASLARQKAFEQAYANGLKAGNVVPRSYGRSYSGGGYRGPRLSYPRFSETTQALGVAQNLANQTGAPVDVEIYG